MKKKLFLAFLCVILTSAAVYCAAKLSNPQNAVPAMASAPVQTSTSEPAVKTYSAEPIELKQGEIIFFELSADEENRLTDFSSSDKNVAKVDSGGRIDAAGEGKATVTAEFSDNSRYECEVTVTKADKKDVDRFSTCITANADVLAKNKKSGSHKNLYEIKVNRRKNCVTVYTYDKNGKYTVPVRAMVCSTGADNSTITGEFGIYFKREWNPLYQDVYGYYTSGISGDYLFHSVPYYSPNPDDLEVEEFNKLGEQASMGCVRLACADSKWIYDNCADNTAVTIYDDENPGPLGKPDTIKISDTHCSWDPTDSNKKNPYYDKSPVISGAKDITIAQSDSFDAINGVSAVDTCSNDITSKIKVQCNVITSHPGKYKVTYSVTDALHRTASKDITVTVK